MIKNWNAVKEYTEMEILQGQYYSLMRENLTNYLRRFSPTGAKPTSLRVSPSE